MFDEQATTYVFRRVQTRGSCLGARSGLQPYRGLPFAGRRGLGITPLGETTPRRAPGRYPKEQSADTRATEDPGARGQDQSAGAGESDIKKGSSRISGKARGDGGEKG